VSKGTRICEVSLVNDAAESHEIRGLVQRCCRGEPAAVASFVERFRDRVFGLCFRLLSHRQDAEDMAQETFVRAIRSLDRWDPARALEPWLLTIAGNRCRTLLAARRRRPVLCDDADRLPDPTPPAHGARELAEELRLGLEGLRAEHREAFLLFHDQQLGYAEIAAALDCPLGTAKTWVHRARLELAEHLRRRRIIEELPDALH